MARARNIKPEFFLDDKLAETGAEGMLLFASLWCQADREGRLEDRPKRIKTEAMPYFDVDIDALLTQLHDLGFIIRFDVDGERYIQIVNFLKHQSPHKNEKPSDIPALPEQSGNVEKFHEQDGALSSSRAPADSGLLIDDSGLLIPDAGESPAEKQSDEPKPKAPRKQPETFVPDDFPLEDRHYEYAAKKGLTKSETEYETERFLLWHGSHQTRHANWYQAWQGWILKAGKSKDGLIAFQKPADPADAPGLTDDQRYAIRKLERMKTREWMNSAEALRYNGSNGSAHYAEDLIVYGKIAAGEPMPARGAA